jgi:hypothetical protein
VSPLCEGSLGTTGNKTTNRWLRTVGSEVQ